MKKSSRSYRSLILAAVLGPALLFAAMAWWSWQRVEREARAEVVRTTDLLHEQAERLVDSDELLLTLIDDRVAGMDWPEIDGQESELRAFLKKALSRVDNVTGAYLADADGLVRVLGLRVPTPTIAGPPPAVSVRDHRYFRAALEGAPMVLNGPIAEPLTGRVVLVMARRLVADDGSFRGVAVVTLSTRSLVQFWQNVVSPGDAVSLVRSDGLVLARVPELEFHPGEASPQFSAATVAHLQASASGVIESLSAIDGIARISGYRRLADYPVHLVYAVDKRNVASDWYPSVVAFGALAAAASAGLLLAALVVIRRAHGEAAALAQAERTALALRASEESHRALFRFAPLPMYALDAERRLLDVNARWLEFLGRTREEVIGRPISDFHAPGEQSDHLETWRQLIDTGNLRDIRRRFAKSSGEIVDVLVSARLERDSSGEFLRSISAMIDITDRLRAEAAMRLERQFSALLAESSTDGIVSVDTDFCCTVWNRAMEALSGISRDAVLGSNIFDLRPDLAGMPAGKAWRAALTGQKTSLHDRPFTFPRSGRSGRYDVDFAPLYAPDRTVIGALAFLRDITERHRMEEQLRQAQKMEAVGQLTGGVAHDFNNLLTVVLGSVDVLRRRVAAGDVPRGDAELQRLVDAVSRAAERGALLTKRLLAFSRRQPLEPAAVEPNRLVAGMSDLLRRTLGEPIAIETILAGGIWRTLVDPNQLENAILNLAVNARDAMLQGGKLTIETANAFLDETYARAHEDVVPGQYVMIAVTDAGIGMAKDVADKAFEPFFTTKGVGQGTGLGLSQVYGFVKQSGGHVKIYSEPGEGTTVKIYLPRLIAAEPERESAAGPPLVESAPKSELILIVEDDDDVRAYGISLLQEMGYRVLAAADGATALRLIASEPEIRLLFSDVALPGGINGRQVADAAVQLRPDMKVLFTTGYARNAIVHQGRLDPGVELLVKPFTYASLAAKLRQMLDAEAKAGASG
jgi:PAS domain S-box-containing protein